MKTKYLFIAALGTLLFASCMNDEFIGTENSPTVAKTETDAIYFGNGFKAMTRAEKYDKDAADALNANFIVSGVKGTGEWYTDGADKSGSATNQSSVFPSYKVVWQQNTAGTTESNTSDWEYVGVTPVTGVTGTTTQTIRYWDYSTAAYNFAAYSLGTGSATGTSIDIDDYTAAETGAYTLSGAAADLTKCYISDMVTVAKANYNTEVKLYFRSLASKVRMAIYETVPGYSIKDVKFFENNTDPRNTDINSNTDAVLFGTNAFITNATYTVSFPTIGLAKTADLDHNQAHVSTTSPTTKATESFDALNYTTAEDKEASGSYYLQRTSTNPSFAGTDTYYKTVLPNPDGVVLEMRVNYTLVATDGSGDEITVYGAKAFVPAVYTKWLPNYAYTYIFKISDNTNGFTNPSDGPEGLFPITFDAVVRDAEEFGTQTTITTVATPSITTYQKGHVYSDQNEYAVDDIYIQVHDNGTLVSDLNELTTPFKRSYLYKLGSAKTEAEVMDALNIRASEGGTPFVITGRNGLTLTEFDFDATITEIPGEDGNDIDVTAGKAIKFTPDAAGTYAYVYQVSAGSNTPVVTTIYGGSAPTDWKTDGTHDYYTDAACTIKATGDWSSTTKYYKQYFNKNNGYAVKVIKVV